ncbi:MAG: sigma 54-interacting transcriptional regulator [Gammaproteobacteria bacterium]|nr:sigma 54-interacting transcriptional regulator [Gammaproteobacteria bacterium]
MNTAKRKVLVVDDDPGLLRLLDIRLKTAGYDVITAESGEQALAKMTVARPSVIVTDLRMSGIDGMTLFDRVHDRDPTLPVIILTAHGSIPDAVEAMKRGAYSFLTKPYDSKTLLDHVEKASKLSGEHPHAEQAGEDASWREDIISRSPLMEDLLSQAWLVANSDASVFIHGESGTGKELLANAIHKASPRRDKPFVAINCAAMPESLLESELFGYVKGAFTGAIKNHKGLFETAHQGTLFLDEVGDMPLAFQAKLLRVLQERVVRPVGATQGVVIDVRVISASHRNLEELMAKGDFREDLYYRLNVVTLDLPTLAQRREDIPLLAVRFLDQLAEKNRKKVDGFSPDALELLVTAPWPGNVRQLFNVVEQTVALTATPIIPAKLVQRALREKPADIPSLVEAKSRFEREYLAQLLQMTNGNVTQAARLAKRNRTEFYKLLHRHHLDPSLFKPAS